MVFGAQFCFPPWLGKHVSPCILSCLQPVSLTLSLSQLATFSVYQVWGHHFQVTFYCSDSLASGFPLWKLAPWYTQMQDFLTGSRDAVLLNWLGYYFPSFQSPEVKQGRHFCGNRRGDLFLPMKLHYRGKCSLQGGAGLALPSTVKFCLKHTRA